MRLYETATGEIVGTQADARASGKGWRQVEVPTDKAGLIAYLNRARPEDNYLTRAADEIVAELTPYPPPPATPALTLTDAEEFIQNADAAQLARLADNVCWRMKELMKGVA